MRIAAYHFESRRARWWRTLKLYARIVWEQGWGVLWDWPRPRDLEYLELRRWNRDMVFGAYGFNLVEVPADTRARHYFTPPTIMANLVPKARDKQDTEPVDSRDMGHD